MAQNDESAGSRSPGTTAPGWPVDARRFRLRLRACLPSTKRALNSAVREVDRLARQCLGTTEGRADLEIAVREALANAMLHGNATRSSAKVLLRCYGDPALGVLVLVRDQGVGFDPEAVPDPRSADRMHLHHGRGLFLMRRLMDRVEYRRGGSEVVLYKRAAPS